MTSSTILAPEDQRVTFVELFFDLVFVFSVTQVVGLLHDGLTWTSAVQAVLVFWLVWWAWTQFTWTLNVADTTHRLIQSATLLTTAVAFFMAAALPEAFHAQGVWFALAYVLVRAIGLGLHIRVSMAADSSLQAAVRGFATLSVGGLLAVLAGGFFGGVFQPWLWGLAILLDIVAAGVGGQSDAWNIHPEHFSERHALFVIIALGETLIVAAGGVTEATWTPALVATAVLSVALTSVLWWTYFPRARPVLEHALVASEGAAQSKMARDVYSLLHFLMLAGVILYAVAVEEAIAHPGEPLPFAGRLALGLGVFLFVGGMGAAIRRATGRLLGTRWLVPAIAALAIILVGAVANLWSLVLALAGIAAVALLEERGEGLRP